MKKLIVGGVISLTTIDYPGYLSAVIFCQGCPWRCRYCHNEYLQNIRESDGLPWGDVIELIRLRKDFVDAVVFSGGEPLIQEGLKNAISDVKLIGLKIGLHTSGAVPHKFAQIVNMLDWVGFDIKAPLYKYYDITRIADSGKLAFESLDILLKANIDYEVRTTLDQTLTIDDILDILKELYDRGVQNVVLQNVRSKKNVIIPHPFLSDVDAMSQARSMFKNLKTRNL